MKLNTLYKSVVEYADILLLYSSDLARHQITHTKYLTLIVRVAVLLCDYWHTQTVRTLHVPPVNSLLNAYKTHYSLKERCLVGDH